MDADDYWRKLERIGWLEFVPDEDRVDLRKRLRADSDTECNQRTCFALTRYSFDWEYLLDEQSYVNLILQLGTTSKGAFRPLDIRCSRSEKNSAKVSFSHGGRDYSRVVPMDTAIVDEAILDIVNEAIADSGSEVRYIDLPRIDQCAYLVLVPPDVYDRAVQEDLIPPAGAFEDSDDPDEQPRNRFSGFTASDVCVFLKRQPFQSFRIRVADGWTYDIRHPQLVMVGRSSLVIGTPAPGESEPIYDRFDTVSLHLVVQIELIGAYGASNA